MLNFVLAEAVAFQRQIAWNRRFAEIYTEDSIGRYTVD
jgi:hypothetical protein